MDVLLYPSEGLALYVSYVSLWTPQRCSTILTILKTKVADPGSFHLFATQETICCVGSQMSSISCFALGITDVRPRL